MRRAIALGLALLLALATPAGAQIEPRTTLPDIEDEVMCPVCGTTLELASEAPQANRQRELIRGLIAQGMTKDEVKDELVAEYGPEILAVPDTEGFDLVAWLAPGGAIVAGGVAIVVGLRRWRRDAAADREAAGTEPAMSAADTERLDADLRRYEP